MLDSKPAMMRKALEHYIRGGAVFVLALEGIFAFPKTLSDKFGCDWSFAAYTAHEFVIPETGSLLSGSPGEQYTEYTKGNLLKVPEGEAMLVPKPSTFENEFGYPADHPDADPEEVEWFKGRKRNEDTPVAVHYAPNRTGALVWFGFVNWGVEIAPTKAFCELSYASLSR